MRTQHLDFDLPKASVVVGGDWRVCHLIMRANVFHDALHRRGDFIRVRHHETTSGLCQLPQCQLLVGCYSQLNVVIFQVSISWINPLGRAYRAGAFLFSQRTHHRILDVQPARIHRIERHAGAVGITNQVFHGISPVNRELQPV